MKYISFHGLEKYSSKLNAELFLVVILNMNFESPHFNNSTMASKNIILIKGYISFQRKNLR